MPLCNKCVCLLTCSTTYSHFQMSTFHKGWTSMAMWQLSKGRSKAHDLSVKPSPYLCSWPGWQTQLLTLHSPWSVCHDKTWNQWCATHLGLPYNEYTHTQKKTSASHTQFYVGICTLLSCQVNAGKRSDGGPLQKNCIGILNMRFHFRYKCNVFQLVKLDIDTSVHES